MEALIDTNVLITFLTDREDPYLKSSYKIVEFCSNGKIKGCMAFHSLSIIWYVLRKQDRERVRKVLLELVNIVSVVGADQNRIREAIKMDDFKDFEDCLQYECAKTAGVDYIITGNVKDYKTISDIRVVTPDEAVGIVESICV